MAPPSVPESAWWHRLRRNTEKKALGAKSPRRTPGEPPPRHWYSFVPYFFVWVAVGALWTPFLYLVLTGFTEAMWGVVCFMAPVTIALGIATFAYIRKGPPPTQYRRR